MDNERTTFKTFDELYRYVDTALVEHSYIPTHQITMVDSIKDAYDISHDILMNVAEYNKNIDSKDTPIPLSYHYFIAPSIVLKHESNSRDIYCPYVHVSIRVKEDGELKWTPPYAINLFVVDGIGEVAYSPHARCFIHETVFDQVIDTKNMRVKYTVIPDNENANLTNENIVVSPMLTHEDVYDFVEIPLFGEEVGFIADWPISFGTVLEIFSVTSAWMEELHKKTGARFFFATKSHALALKGRANRYGIRCGYIELEFINNTEGKICFACGINAFPILNQGITYFSPLVRTFLLGNLEEGMDFGEIKLKKCKIIW